MSRPYWLILTGLLLLTLLPALVLFGVGYLVFPDDFSPIWGVVVLVGLVALNGNNLAPLLYRRRNPRRYEPLDAAKTPPEVPTQLQTIDAELLKKGFTHAGTVQEILPVVIDNRLWLYLSADQTTAAWLSLPMQVLRRRTGHTLRLVSYFPDGAAVETLNPSGLNRDQPDYVQQFTGSPVPVTLRLHDQQVAAVAERFGAPLALADVDAVLAQERVYANADGARTAAPLLRRALINGLLLGLGFTALMSYIAIPPGFSNDPLGWPLMILMIVALTAGAAGWLASMGGDGRSRLQPEPADDPQATPEADPKSD
ncbi:MAG: hypothetical protein GYB67_06000 [Chloroflexi bacterium]|nr:hypothetical protein [Chloroflexota bacterium]